MPATWVVVLEAVDAGAGAGSVEERGPEHVHGLLGYVADGDPAVLVGPGRWAVQLWVTADGPAEAVRSAASAWRAAVERFGTARGELVRVEVVAEAEHERECECAGGAAPPSGRGDDTALLALAFRDPLTHLATRALFVDTVERALLAGPLPGTFHALVVVDVDDLAAVNAASGRCGGDRVLRAAAAAIVGTVRRSDLVARLGDDSFAVLLRSTGTATARAVADRCVAAARTATAPGLASTASAGVAMAHAHHNAEALLDEALTAAAFAHRAGGDRSVLFGAATLA